MASRHPHSRIPSVSNNTAAGSHASSSNTLPNSTAATGTGTNTTSQQAMPPTSVRRNLFHHHLSRRPASASSAPTANNGSNGSTSGGIPKAAPTTAVSLSTASSFDNGDIVARDKNGGYKVDVPTLPPGMFGEDTDDGGVGDGVEGIEVGVRVGDEEMTGREKEKIEASIVEMMYRNRSRQINSEPSEILLLIQQSLRNKVAELEEDKWMYEVEEEMRV